MAILLLGAIGMLGQAISAEARRRGLTLVAVSRHGPDRVVDLSDPDGLRALLSSLRPELIVNAAAIASIGACERDRHQAYRVNTAAVAILVEYCRTAAARFVQISTDHFFSGDGAAPHGEGAPVTLLNEYARTKHLAEGFALVAPGALVLRTNVTGLRGRQNVPTFAEWALDALTRRKPLRLFDDFFTSTIDTPSFAAAMFDLIDRRAHGIVNLAARTVASKRTFVHALAHALDIRLDWDEPASVLSLVPPRAESLGLDVTKAERLLGYALPDTERVCHNLVSHWKEQCAIPLAS
ncbi:MAG TPA: sugar nucleotide-binding protein [Stellaceae bacterium]|nr:sugar nucleotide-binding protein [Stellaceae bacterium]